MGPVRLLEPIRNETAARDCDVWGNDRSLERRWQSYFLLFQRTALTHPAFRELWRTVENHTDRIQVIHSYEAGPSTPLREEGLARDAYTSIGSCTAMTSRGCRRSFGRSRTRRREYRSSFCAWHAVPQCRVRTRQALRRSTRSDLHISRRAEVRSRVDCPARAKVAR